MMPESRDRLVRHVDPAEVFARRRSNTLRIQEDGPEERLNPFEPPFRRGAMGTAAAVQGPVALGRRGVLGTGSFGTPRRTPNVPRRNVYATPTPLTARGRGQATPARVRSVLPTWYPRRPLQDITVVYRAYERRAARLRETEGQQSENSSYSPVPQMNVPSERNISVLTPIPAVTKKLCTGENTANKIDVEDSEFLTPQRKLLNQIDMIEKVVVDELRKFERTPSAKKAQREKRVRTLMSMR